MVITIYYFIDMCFYTIFNKATNMYGTADIIFNFGLM